MSGWKKSFNDRWRPGAAKQQLVENQKLLEGRRDLILDEPTTALSENSRPYGHSAGAQAKG
jgi:hypothetical protein